jgi:hypothetical protein
VLGGKSIYRLKEDVFGYIYIKRDKVTFDGDGHTLYGEKEYYWPMSSQILLDNVDHCTVKELTFKDFYGFGIVIKCDYNTVFKCHFYLEDWWEEASGVEIHGSYNVVKKCTFDSPENGWSWMGVALVGVEHNTVLNCEFNYIGEAILSINPHNHIIANRISYGYTGIDGYSDCTSCVIKSNKIMYTSRAIYIFMGFGYPHDNLITENTICNNMYGIDLNINENLLCNNNICCNNYAFDLGGTSDNVLHHNNIIDNTKVFYSSSSAGDNTWDDGEGEGNYWSDYEGEDTDHDGVGDTDLPHNGVDYYPLMEEV